MIEAMERVREPRQSPVAFTAATKSGGESPVARAARHLIGADDVAIYQVDLSSRAVEPLEEWGKRGPIDRKFRHFLAETAEGSEQLGSAPVWFAGVDDGAATLVVRIVQRGATAILLVADFAKAGVTTRGRAAKLVPDLVTLIRHHIGTEERLRQSETTHDAMKAVLDQGECGVAIVDGGGRLAFANAAAERFLAAGDGLQLRRGIVKPTGYAEAVRFRAALDEVADAASMPACAKGPRAMAMLLPRQGGGRPTILAIAPLGDQTGAERRAGGVLLYILPADQASTSPLHVVCRLHGLSRIETLLVVHLISGLTLAEAATEIRVKLETARAYLKQVFAKTGTHRQVDAVALISRYARAMRGGFDFQPA